MRIRRIGHLRISLLYEITVYFIIVLFTFFRALGESYKYAQLFIVFLGFVLAGTFLVKNLRVIKANSLMVFAPVLAFAAINRVFIGSISIIDLVVFFVTAFGVGLYLIYTDSLSIKLVLSLYVFSAVTLVLINHSNSDTYFLFEGLVSRNYISVFLGIWLFIVVLAYSKQQQSPPLFLYALYFVACVFSVGRMGIACSGLLLILVLFDRFVKPSKKITKGVFIRYSIFCLIALFVVVLVFREFYWLVEQLFSRFVDPGNVGSNSERKKMLIQYFEVMLGSFQSFIFGFRTELLSPEYYHHNGNAHSCFLTIHSRTGIVSLSFIVYTMIYTILRLYRSGNKDLAFVSFIIIIRGLTDRFMIGDIGDIFVGFCLLYFAEFSKSE